MRWLLPNNFKVGDKNNGVVENGFDADGESKRSGIGFGHMRRGSNFGSKRMDLDGDNVSYSTMT
ncbi:myosin-2 isoform X1 [Sesbania bispinosa]|nr:myosin-2 isoform X1 [Sesbania bispinosa]